MTLLINDCFYVIFSQQKRQLYIITFRRLWYAVSLYLNSGYKIRGYFW